MFLSLFNGCSVSFPVVKLTDRNDVPSIVLQELKNIELERGFYYFMGDYTKSKYEYLVICGDSQTTGYDVVVEEVDFRKELSYSGELFLTVRELDSNPEINYINDYSKPIIIFRIKRAMRLPSDIHIASDCGYLSLKYWLGSEELSGKDQELLYEVIQEKKDIPEVIWNAIADIPLESGIYEFDQNKFKTKNLYFLVHGGETYADDYNIFFEEVEKTGIAKTPDTVRFVKFTLHEDGSRGSMPYASAFKYPFVILKFTCNRQGLITYDYNIPVATIINELGEKSYSQVYRINKSK